MSILSHQVLKLNKLWQAIDVTNVETAFMDMCRGAIMGLDTENLRPMSWAEWITLPIRENDEVIQTVRGPVRVPTVVLCVAYTGRRPKRPKLSNQAIKERDRCICQVTGEYAPDGNVDHGVPKSRGGKDTWENLRWMKRELNQKKNDRTLEEMGWKPIGPAKEPKSLLPEQFIRPLHPDWNHFLIGSRS